MAEGLTAAQAIKPGHGNVIAALATKPDFLGGQLGYEQHLASKSDLDVALFANAVVGARSTPAGWVPDVGALGGIKFSW